MMLEGIHIVTLLTYRPALNSIEKRWESHKNQIFNKLRLTIERLNSLVGYRQKDWWAAFSEVISLLGKG